MDRRPSEIDANRAERTRRGDVEMVPLAAAEGEVRGDLWQQQLADQGAVGMVAVPAVMSGAPEPAQMIKSDAVIAFGIRSEDFTASQLSMINIKDPDVV